MALDNDQKKLCADWVSAPNRKWQTLSRSQWKYQFREKTLVRYVEEAKMDEGIVPLLLEYLSSDDCKETLQLYGQSVSSDWTPVRAWYELSNKAVGNVRAVRLYHAVAIQPENGTDDNDGNMYVVQDGCAYKVGFTYFWKRESVVDVATAYPSTSGVQYQIVNLQRDPETGLFNYAVEKRERVQQDIEEYLTRTTAFEDVSEEAHLGVRGDLSLGGKEARSGGGVTVRRKVTKNSDCTHDVQNVIERSKPVRDAVVEKRMTLNGLTVRRTHRNQRQPGEDPVEVGEGVTSSMNDDETYNVVETKEGAEPAGQVSESCERDNFGHSHTVTSNDAEAQDPETAFEPGKVVRKSSSNAGNGTSNNTTVTTTATPSEHTERWSDAYGDYEHCVYRNQREPRTPTRTGDNIRVSPSFTKNQFGLFDGSYTVSDTSKSSGGGDGRDAKFNIVGPQETFYSVRRNARTRHWEHSVQRVQVRYIRGNTYASFLDLRSQASLTRTNSGLLAIKLVGKYRDSNRNLLAEWVQVSLMSDPENWVKCDRQCLATHGAKLINWSTDNTFIVNSLLAMA